MEVYRKINNVPYYRNSFVTLGTFDGIHLGHREIIKNLVSEAQELDGRSVLITFYPHPQSVVQSSRRPIELLTPIDEKIEILKNTGLDAMVILPFTLELANTEPEIFLEEQVVKRVGVLKFIIGFNHAFGRGRRGREKLFQEMGSRLGYAMEVIAPVKRGEEEISSTRIRNLLKEGKVHQANRLLGWNYHLHGIVKKGNGLGGKIGFPTANIDVLGEKKLVPGDGVYAVIVEIDDQQMTGMANLGFKPTVMGTKRSIEVHIHDFSGDLYGKKIKIEFVERLRNERQFDSTDALVSQIELDQKKSLELLSKYIRR